MSDLPITAHKLCVCGLISFTCPGEASTNFTQKEPLLLSAKANSDLSSFLIALISSIASCSFDSLLAQIDTIESLKLANVSKELHNLMAIASSSVDSLFDFISFISNIISFSSSTSTSEQQSHAEIRPFSLFGHFIRQATSKFDSLNFLESSFLADSLSKHIKTGTIESLFGCAWSSSVVANAVSTSPALQQQKNEIFENIETLTHSKVSTGYLRFSEAVESCDIESAEKLAHSFIDECNIRKTNPMTSTKEKEESESENKIPRVLLPFGELMLAQAHLKVGNLNMVRQLLSESLQSALEWNSDSCISQVTWIQALVSTTNHSQNSLLVQDMLFRRAFHRAPKGKSGAMQRVNCSLALALVHASIPPSMTFGPILQLNSEPSPKIRSLSHLTIAHSSALEINGKLESSIAKERIKIVEKLLEETWGTIPDGKLITQTKNDKFIENLLTNGEISEALNAVSNTILQDHSPHDIFRMLLKLSDLKMQQSNHQFIPIVLTEILQVVAESTELEQKTITSLALIALAKFFLTSNDQNAGLKAQKILHFALENSLLPPLIEAKTRILRARSYLHEIRNNNSNQVEMLINSVSELLKAQEIIQPISDFKMLAEVYYLLSIVYNSLGWIDLRNDSAENWKQCISHLKTKK